MNIAGFSIKRPIFITCIVATILLFGLISFKRIGIDLMPSIDFPVVMVSTTYSGAAPEEVANQISKPLEEQLSALANVKHISSTNTEGISTIAIEYPMGTDIDKAAQDVRDKVSIAKASLPDDAEDPVVAKMDPDSFPVMKMTLFADLSAAEVYDLANEKIKPQLARVDGVSEINILGGTRREIQVDLDKAKLDEYKISMTTVVTRLASAGSNVAIGNKEEGASRTVFRAMGDFTSLEQIENTTVLFSGDMGHSVTIKDLGTVSDGTTDVTSSGYVYYPSSYKGSKKDTSTFTPKKDAQLPCLYMTVSKQSGSNSVKVSDGIRERIAKINASFVTAKGSPHIEVAVDTTDWTRTNIDEALSSIIIGILLAIAVVYLFLGNVRSTIITAIAIPNSLLGAFIIMYLNGYTLNLMTLMALSLTVGLLVDDAIVVRENIFRKLEAGEKPSRAAEIGTTEVMLAVIATTMTIMSVFLPMGTISGIIGSFLKQFGFTVVFAMAVSLFDALTVAPFLSAYFAGKGKKENNAVIRAFENFQEWMDRTYTRVLGFCLRRPKSVIAAAFLVFLSSIVLVGFVKISLIPSHGDRGNFAVTVSMPSGTSLAGTKDTLAKIETRIRQIKDLKYYMVIAGDSSGDPKKGEIDVFLSPDRKKGSEEYSAEVRTMLMKEFAYATPKIGDLSTTSSGGHTPFQMIVSGSDLALVEKTAGEVYEQIRTISDFVDTDSTMKKGNPELRVKLNPEKMRTLGVSPTAAGMELRYCVAGNVPAQFHDSGLEYDIRARLEPEQRNLAYTYSTMRVPNLSGSMVALSSIGELEKATGSSAVYRQDKAYVVKITAAVAANGALNDGMKKAAKLIKDNVKVPDGVNVGFAGQSEEMGQTIGDIVFVVALALIFIYMVLASLYESFFTPFTILLAIPPAMTGALFALFVSGFQLDMFSMIGMVLLMGLVTKNSILLVDFACKGVAAGMSCRDAVLAAGRKRLRPIMMTTFAMLAGMIPLAAGLGQAAKMRQGMGIAIIGGLILSTVITLLVVPSIFEFVDNFRERVESKFRIRESGRKNAKTKNP